MEWLTCFSIINLMLGCLLSLLILSWVFMNLKRLNEYNPSKLKFYLRYDDVLAAFEKEQDSLHFLNFLNNKHRS